MRLHSREIKQFIKTKLKEKEKKGDSNVQDCEAIVSTIHAMAAEVRQLKVPRLRNVRVQALRSHYQQRGM
jgi:cytochrome c peroxidase